MRLPREEHLNRGEGYDTLVECTTWLKDMFASDPGCLGRRQRCAVRRRAIEHCCQDAGLTRIGAGHGWGNKFAM